MKTIRYDLIGAYQAGIEIHPQKQVEILGMKCIKFEGAPIADCVFMEVENVPEQLPSYIEFSNYKIIT